MSEIITIPGLSISDTPWSTYLLHPERKNFTQELMQWINIPVAAAFLSWTLQEFDACLVNVVVVVGCREGHVLGSGAPPQTNVSRQARIRLIIRIWRRSLELLRAHLLPTLSYLLIRFDSSLLKNALSTGTTPLALAVIWRHKLNFLVWTLPQTLPVPTPQIRQKTR